MQSIGADSFPDMRQKKKKNNNNNKNIFIQNNSLIEFFHNAKNYQEQFKSKICLQSRQDTELQAPSISQ